MSWIKYLNIVNRNTPATQLWRVIKSLSGTPRSPRKIIISLNDTIISEPNELVVNFGRFFSSVSSNNNYSEVFLTHKVEEEFTPIVFPPSNGKNYNKDFTLKELKTALRSCTDTSPGEDDIPYIMIKKLPKEQLNHLLAYYNYIWKNSLFPDEWRTAIVLPFLKPNKPPGSLSSYRPISLTSCLCKLLEKMVLIRLNWYLEKHKYIKPYQSGFKKLHSTYDPLVRFESAIQEAFINDEYLVAVFIDLEKAYDMVWQHLVLKTLKEIGLKGNLPKFIANFMKNRKIKVKIEDFISEAFDLDNGLPQGSVLSCVLFLLIINSIFEDAENIIKSLFCDDGLFWATGPNLEDVIDIIQKALDCIAEWCDYHGPKISVLKTHYTIFTKKVVSYDPILTLNGTNLKRENIVKYLGVTFDQRLTWAPHINKLVEICKSPLNMMRKVSRHDWGGDRSTLKLMYTSLVRSKIDYASFLYSKAADTHLIKLDRIQYEAIRIITGNYICTVTDNLEAEINLRKTIGCLHTL